MRALSKNEKPKPWNKAEIEGTKANDVAITPQEIMILAIHRRAPTLSRIKLDGTSKYKVAEEEDARAESEHLGGEAQLLVHGERRKPDIYAIQIGDEVA